MKNRYFSLLLTSSFLYFPGLMDYAQAMTTPNKDEIQGSTIPLHNTLQQTPLEEGTPQIHTTLSSQNVTPSLSPDEVKGQWAKRGIMGYQTTEEFLHTLMQEYKEILNVPALLKDMGLSQQPYNSLENILSFSDKKWEELRLDQTLKNVKKIHKVLSQKGRRDFSRLYLSYAKLKWADLYKANLQGANLYKANLQGAYLQGADLRGADLRGADLQGADLQLAYLQEADLQKAKLKWADLQWANLKWAKLQEANLQNADLQKAKLQWADLQGADLQLAYLQGADLTGADVRGANLQGARDADLTLSIQIEPKHDVQDLEISEVQTSQLHNNPTPSSTSPMQEELSNTFESNQPVSEKKEDETVNPTSSGVFDVLDEGCYYWSDFL